MQENAGKCMENAGKMRTRITPNTDSFYAMIIKPFLNRINKKLELVEKNTILRTNWIF